MLEQRSKKNIFSEWLEQLQQESWQLELLISGLALFGIWESRSGLMKLENYFDTNLAGEYLPLLSPLIDVFWAGWAIFMTNLLIHIILRGLWIGAIGLRYVSGDIDFDELNYSDIFRRFFKKRIGGFDEYIERLEKLSSVIFSFTFLLFMMLFSIVFLNLVFALVSIVISNVFYPDFNGPPPGILLFGFVFYGIGFLVLIDFITLGGFKKVKDPTFSKIYFWIYRIFSILSLSFIYRPLLLNFIDNRYTRRLFFFAFPYMIVLIMGFRLMSLEKYSYIPDFDKRGDIYDHFVDEESVNWNNYDDLRLEHHTTYSDLDRPLEKSRIVLASLDKHEMSGSFGKVFLSYHRNDNKMIARQHPDFTKYKETGINHRMFFDGEVEDTVIEGLKTQQLREIKYMLKVVRNQEELIDSTETREFGHLYDEYTSKTKDDIGGLRAEIVSKYSDQRNKHAKDRIKRSKEIIQSNYKIWIDDISYSDSLQCSFYTHPNLHERGLLCYFPLKSLNVGPHIIHLRKAYNDDDCTDNCPEHIKNIPFRVLD